MYNLQFLLLLTHYTQLLTDLLLVSLLFCQFISWSPACAEFGGFFEHFGHRNSCADTQLWRTREMALTREITNGLADHSLTTIYRKLSCFRTQYRRI